MPSIYKICPEALWRAAEREGVFRGAPDDLRDGFIHFSTAAQLSGILAKHFAGQQNLLLIAVEAETLGPALKWEISRGGETFPHLYGEWRLASALRVAPLPLEPDGRHRIPELAA